MSTEEQNTAGGNTLKTNTLFAFKVGMSTVYDDNGEAVPVTLLKYEPLIVSQIKTKDKDGYSALQVAFKPRSAKTANASQKGHLKGAGFENGAYHMREIRQEIPAGATVGQKISLDSLTKGDLVAVRGYTKGRGFQGSVKRFGFAGGPGAHGSKFHRQPGSSGNRTWPGRVMPGKRFPGHYGDEMVTVRNLRIVDIVPEENVVILKGAVPGAPNGLIELVKE